MLPRPLPVLFLGLLIFTTACGPLVPVSYVDGSPGSKLTQSIETNDATVWLRYMESQNGYMIFDLEIANHSPDEMPVAPQQISFYASSKEFMPLLNGNGVHDLSAPNSTLTMTRQFASDPSSVENSYIQKAKAKKTGAGLLTLLAVGLMVYDAAQDGKKEVVTSRDEWKAVGRDILVTTALAASDIAKASATQTAIESHYLPYELFPECTIKSGGNVRGKVFMPKESSNRYVRVVVPIGNDDYVFDFKRRGTK